MRIGFAAKVWAAVAVAGGSVGCGGSVEKAGSAGALRPAGSTQASSANCQTSLTQSTGKPARPCVFVFSDGARFSCPQTFGHVAPGTETLELAGDCRRLLPLAIPLSWRQVFTALDKARSCLSNEGLDVAGGPSLGLPRDSPETPIGELSIADGDALTLIGFYVNSRVARQSASAALRKVKPLGQVARRHEAIILWTRRPTSAQRTLAESCAFGRTGRP